MTVTRAEKYPNGNYVCKGELHLIKANYPNLAGYNLYVLGNTWYKGIIVATDEPIFCGDECYDLNYKCEVTYDQGPKAHLKKIIATSEQFDHKLTNKILTKDIRSGQKLVVICEDQSYNQSIGDKGEFLYIDKYEIKVVEGHIKVILKRDIKTSSVLKVIKTKEAFLTELDKIMLLQNHYGAQLAIYSLVEKYYTPKEDVPNTD